MQSSDIRSVVRFLKVAAQATKSGWLPVLVGEIEVIAELWEGVDDAHVEVKAHLEGLLVQLGNISATEATDDFE
jgi:hypothetical protein